MREGCPGQMAESQKTCLIRQAPAQLGWNALAILTALRLQARGTADQLPVHGFGSFLVPFSACDAKPSLPDPAKEALRAYLSSPGKAIR